MFIGSQVEKPVEATLIRLQRILKLKAGRFNLRTTAVGPLAPANNSRTCGVVSFSDGRTLCSSLAASWRRAGRSRCPQAGSSPREGGREIDPSPDTGCENPDSNLLTQSGRKGSVPGLRTARGGWSSSYPRLKNWRTIGIGITKLPARANNARAVLGITWGGTLDTRGLP